VGAWLSQEKELACCFDGQTWFGVCSWWVVGDWIKRLASNSQRFEQRMIRLERCIETNFHLNLILNCFANCQNVFQNLFSPFFPAEVVVIFCLTGQQLT
jgi:hypothetical protein